MGNCFAKICQCYEDDPNGATHSSYYSRMHDDDEDGNRSAYSSNASHESMKYHKHYQQNKQNTLLQQKKDCSPIYSSCQQKKQKENTYSDSTKETKEEDKEDREDYGQEQDEDDMGGLAQMKVNTNSNSKPKKICLLKKGYLSAITEEDDLIRASTMISKREQFSRLFSIVNNNPNIGLISDDKDGYKITGGLIDDDRRRTIDRSTINLVIEEMKNIESLPIETVIDELLNIISKDQPMCDTKEGMNIPEVLPEYQSICSAGMKRLLMIFVSDLTKEGFQQEYAAPAEGVIPDSCYYEEWLREALFEAKIKEASARYQEKVKEQLSKDQGQLSQEQQARNTQTNSSEIAKSDGSSQESEQQKQHKNEEENNTNNINNNSYKIVLNNNPSSSNSNEENNNSSTSNINVSSMNNNTNNNSFGNYNKDNCNISCKSPTLSKNNSTSAITITPSSSILTDYSRILVKPATEDNYKYFLLRSEYNLQGIDAKRLLECMVNEQWSRENNPSIDVFETLGTFQDYKLLYISYKKVLMTSPRDFLYLKCNKRLSSNLYLSLQVSVELDAYPPQKGKERAIVKLGGTLLKDAERKGNICNCENCENEGSNKEKELGCTLQVMNYTESNLKLTLNHKLTLKPTVSEVKRYIQRLQSFVKEEKGRENK